MYPLKVLKNRYILNLFAKREEDFSLKEPDSNEKTPQDNPTPPSHYKQILNEWMSRIGRGLEIKGLVKNGCRLINNLC
jgi:hypothetical protein